MPYRALRLPAALLCLSACLSLGLAGCVPATQALKADPGPVPVLLEPTATGLADAHQVHWRSFFKDPQLQQLIESALAHNRDLRVAAARVEEARAQWALVKAERLPLLQLGAQARLDRAYAEGLSTGPQRRLDIGVSMASFELDFFGKLANQSAAARANYLATDEARRAAELTLISQIAELYHAQLQTRVLLQRGERSLASRQRSLEIVSRARELGLAHELEQQAARMQLAQAQAQMAQLGHLQTQTDALLLMLSGNPPAGSLPHPPTVAVAARALEALSESYRVPLGLSAEVLLLRPDVQGAEQRLLGAQASVAAARAAFFPRVALTASAGTASSGLTSLFKTGAWTFAPSITLPIFDGGRTQAGFDMAKAREAAVVAQYERTVQQAFREVADQLSARASVRAQREASDETLASQRIRLQVQQQRHAAGLIGLLEVLDAERDLLAAEQAQVLVVRAELDAAVGLYRVLGGGAPPPADSRMLARAPNGPGQAAAPVTVTVVEPHGHR
jgi:multidrug efflux system outer membrane protein